MRVELPENLSSLSDAELTRLADDADHIRVEALLALRLRGSSEVDARREQRLAGMSPSTRRAVETLMNATPRRLGLLSVAIAAGIMLLGGMGDCARPAAQTVGTTQRVLRDLDEVMKEQREQEVDPVPRVRDEAADKAWGF